MVQNGRRWRRASGCALGARWAIGRHVALLRRARQPGRRDSSASVRRFPGRHGTRGERGERHLCLRRLGASGGDRGPHGQHERPPDGPRCRPRVAHRIRSRQPGLPRLPRARRRPASDSAPVWWPAPACCSRAGGSGRHEPLVPVERRDGRRERPRHRVLGGRDRRQRRAHLAGPGQAGDVHGKRWCGCGWHGPPSSGLVAPPRNPAAPSQGVQIAAASAAVSTAR